MKLASYNAGFGRVDGDLLVPMGASLLEYLEGRPAVDGQAIPLSEVQLRAPLPRPGKIIAVGPNYRAHADEADQLLPESADDLIVMAKFANSVIGPSDEIEVPAAVSQVDYEAELAFVIGTTAREVNVVDALDHVAGYLCVNDVTDRNNQFRLGGLRGLIRGKAVDTFLPTGPFLVTRDEIPDPQQLEIICEVNGQVVQRAPTADMVFGIAEIVSSLSKTLTLEPGDMVATGSPPGVGWGRDPQVFLTEGDLVSVTISKIGSLRNRVVSRKPSTRERP